ncbi:MAG: hypothetical protein WBE60_07390 [Nitrosotalea sp.]
MDFDYGLAKDIILVSIPVLGACVTTGLTASNWQKRKEINNIKREILSDYERGPKSSANLNDMFYDMIFTTYVNWNSSNIIPPIDDDIILPKDEKDFPYEKMSEEYKEYKKQLYAHYSFSSRFLSTLRFYYADPEMGKKFKEIENLTINSTYIIDKIVFCKNEKEFKKLLSIYYHNGIKIRPLIEEFEKSLARTKIRISSK